MNSKTIFLFVFVISISSFAQIDLRSSMGINLVNTPYLQDYLQENYAQGELVSSFNSAVEFGLEAGYEFDKYQLGLEYAYEMSSFTYSFLTGNYNFEYGLSSPSIMGYYLIKGNGYKFKLGGGVGPRFISVDEQKPPLSKATSYSATGVGLLLRADGITSLGGNFFAFIGVDARYNLIGKPENNGSTIIINSSKDELKMNSLSFGIKLGVSAIF